MGRKKKKDSTTVKKGAPDHFTGYKMAFLTSQATSYQNALDSRTVAAFYNKVTRDFIAKFGENEPFNKEPDEDPPDPDDMDIDEDNPLTKEEAEASAALYVKLRTVIFIFFYTKYLRCSNLIHTQKLGQWYRQKYKRPEVTKSESSTVNPFTSVLAASIDKPP